MNPRDIRLGTVPGPCLSCAMLDAVFLHRRSVANVGDLHCSPGLYFDLGAHEMADFGAPAPPCRMAVLGGGQVWRDCLRALIYETEKARHKVIWGVGISARDAASIEFDIAEGGARLIASRNWNVPRCEFVPCASAMSPLFDRPAAPLHEVVLFTHGAKSAQVERVSGIPEMSNKGASMAEAVAFLASGATVVTNSYHGTFWAMCLGRRVLCLPFSAKFLQFRENPICAAPGEWSGALPLAEARPGVLEEARDRNRAFCDKVRDAMTCP